MSLGIFENEKISMRQLEILVVANNLALGLILLPELFFNGFYLWFVVDKNNFECKF